MLMAGIDGIDEQASIQAIRRSTKTCTICRPEELKDVPDGLFASLRQAHGMRSIASRDGVLKKGAVMDRRP